MTNSETIKSDQLNKNLPKNELTRVDFYVSKEAIPQFALRTACRLAEKAFSAGHRIHILLKRAEDCKTLDTLLWTFRDRSFIPHEVSSSPIKSCPVTISTEISSDIEHSHVDMLLNLATEIPENCMQFQRIAEIIDSQPESIHAGRERYRFYRECGLDPLHHEVSSA